MSWTTSTRARVWEIVEAGKKNDMSSVVFDLFIIILIVLSVAAIILESVESIGTRFQTSFRVFEVVSVTIFAFEYLGRLWGCTNAKKLSTRTVERLRFMIKPLPAIDLLAILPSLFLLGGVDLRFLRLMRVFRILRLSALVRYSESIQLLVRVFRRCWRELAITLFAVVILLLLSSCLMYFAENEAQPEVFSDIPTTMWWAVITITTVGYGDAFPITIAGKILTAAIAMLGVAVLALPTAIIGSAFVEELQAARGVTIRCPDCGKEIEV